MITSPNSKKRLCRCGAACSLVVMRPCHTPMCILECDSINCMHDSPLQQSNTRTAKAAPAPAKNSAIIRCRRSARRVRSTVGSAGIVTKFCTQNSIVFDILSFCFSSAKLHIWKSLNFGFRFNQKVPFSRSCFWFAT